MWTDFNNSFTFGFVDKLRNKVSRTSRKNMTSTWPGHVEVECPLGVRNAQWGSRMTGMHLWPGRRVHGAMFTILGLLILQRTKIMRRITDTDEVHNEVQNHQCSTANSSKSTSQLYTTTTTSVRKETSYCKCRRAYCRGVDGCSFQ